MIHIRSPREMLERQKFFVGGAGMIEVERVSVRDKLFGKLIRLALATAGSEVMIEGDVHSGNIICTFIK
jgi:hypothetical protein